MQTSAKDQQQEQLLLQTAVRQASRGKGSAFFNLLFPFSLIVAFSVFYIAPLLVAFLLGIQHDYLDRYLLWSPPVITLAACCLYGILRHQRLKPVIKKLRIKLDNGEAIT